MADRTVLDDLTDARAEIAALTAAAATAEQAHSAIVAERDSLVAAQSATAADLAKAASEITALTATLTETKAERDAMLGRAEKAESMLALRQFTDIAGAKPVDDATLENSGGNIQSQFESISDPVEKTKFYREHRSQLWAARKQ